MIYDKIEDDKYNIISKYNDFILNEGITFLSINRLLIYPPIDKNIYHINISLLLIFNYFLA